MERNRTRKTTGFWPLLLSDGFAQWGQNEGVAPLLLGVDAGELPKQVGSLSVGMPPPSSETETAMCNSCRMAFTRMVDDSGECLVVVATEFEGRSDQGPQSNGCYYTVPIP